MTDRGAAISAPWLSYDSVVETYERVAVPWFEPMARDLIEAVAPPSGAVVLDVGTGTGLTAELAAAVVGSSGQVVGVDPSVGMLRLARSRRRVVAAAGAAPGLPVRDRVVDAVLANLVVSHVPDLAAALRDMARVLRAGGRLGVTAWAPDPGSGDEQSQQADELVARAREECGLPSETPVHGAPWEDRLRDRSNLVSHLADAGLVQVEATAHLYRHEFAIDDYLSGWGGLGRYHRWKLGEQRWHAFSTRAGALLRQRFGDTVVSAKRAWVATGFAG